MLILQILDSEVVEPEATQTLTAAFDIAWNVLRRSGSTLAADQNAIVARRVLAKRIIVMWRSGERDEQCLVQAALVHVASCKMISRGMAQSRTTYSGTVSKPRGSK